MIWYRILFLNPATFWAAAAGTFFLLIAGSCLMALTGQLTIFTTACALLIFVMSAGLTVARKRDDLLRTGGLVGGILLVELCRYIYQAEQTLSIGVDAIVSLGLVQCMLFSTHLMVCFIILMVTYNHFTIHVGKNSGRTKLIVNQISICILLLCFLVMTVQRWFIADQLLRQTANVLGCLADLCLFVVIACCELYLTVDGQILSVYRREG